MAKQPTCGLTIFNDEGEPAIAIFAESPNEVMEILERVNAYHDMLEQVEEIINGGEEE